MGSSTSPTLAFGWPIDEDHIDDTAADWVEWAYEHPAVDPICIGDLRYWSGYAMIAVNAPWARKSPSGYGPLEIEPSSLISASAVIVPEGFHEQIVDARDFIDLYNVPVASGEPGWYMTALTS